ncbi:hypothetical protein [Sphingobium amiense]|uniref:hypothetical protein n=1 Tax=Sphingobium amiense TaxID=135719 RepID=UPI000F837301|nr:hypothetical protein [Sphingobium amiense]
MATSDAAFRGGACPTPEYTIAYTGNYTTSADANIAQDPVQAELLLTGAAVGGDPRAVAAIRQMLETGALCPKDKQLHDLWGSLALYRNMIYGTYELNNAPAGTLVAMSDLYEYPCQGRPVQSEAAKTLRSLAGGPRHIWIYVPG